MTPVSGRRLGLVVLSTPFQGEMAGTVGADCFHKPMGFPLHALGKDLAWLYLLSRDHTSR